jgi:hypothetical protein
VDTQRLMDLVRQQRMELLAADLITREEYAALAQEHGAVARLESYDQVREKMAHLDSDLRAAQEAVAWAYQFAAANSAPVWALDNLSAVAHGQAAPHEWQPAEPSEILRAVQEEAGRYREVLDEIAMRAPHHPEVKQ